MHQAGGYYHFSWMKKEWLKMAKSFPKNDVLGLDWNDLKFFLAVARAGGLTAAAQELGTSPSTVSRHIEALEQRLGVTLFLRQQTGYLLTDQGKEMLEPIGTVEQSMLTVERRGDSVQQEERISGRVRLATSEGLATFLVAPHLMRFWQRYPLVQVELISGAALVDLGRREADLALRFVNPSEHSASQDYIAMHLGAIHFNPYCARSLVGDNPVDLAQLVEQLDYISWDDDWTSLPMANWIARQFHDKKPILTSNSLIVHYQAVRSGAGLALLPDYIGLQDPLLYKVPLPEHLIPKRDLWLVYHRDLKASQRVIVMRDFLKELVQGIAA